MIGCIGASIFGVASSWSPNVTVFAVLRFLSGMCIHGAVPGKKNSIKIFFNQSYPENTGSKTSVDYGDDTLLDQFKKPFWRKNKNYLYYSSLLYVWVRIRRFKIQGGNRCCKLCHVGHRLWLAFGTVRNFQKSSNYNCNYK